MVGIIQRSLHVFLLACVLVSFSSSVFADEQKAKGNKQACEEAEKKAQQACNDSAQPAQQAQQQQNQQSQNQGGSAQQNCQQRASILPDLLKMLGALQGGCQQAQADCKQKCGQAKASPSTDCNDVQPPDPRATSCKTAAADTSQKGSEDTGKCEQLDKNLGKIAQMIADAMKNLQAAQECKDQTNCQNPTYAAANPTTCAPTVNCNDPATLVGKPDEALKCKCQQTPRAEGCPGAEAQSDALKDAAQRKNADGTPATTSPTAKTSNSPSEISSFGGSSSRAAGVGAGGGGGAKGAIAEKGSHARDGTPSKSDPTQVNMGDYPGGSGGGKGGSGYPDPNDPARGPAGKKILSRAEQYRLETRDGFTGANGRSNWEKVRSRYRDNQSSLTP